MTCASQHTEGVLWKDTEAFLNKTIRYKQFYKKIKSIVIRFMSDYDTFFVRNLVKNMSENHLVHILNHLVHGKKVAK